MYSLIPTFTQIALYRVRRNQAHLNDDIWLGVQAKSTQVDFYSILKSDYAITGVVIDNKLIEIYINLDVHIDLYQRTVFSFLDSLGFIGGLFQIFKMIGFVFAFYFASKSYYSSILSKFWISNKETTKIKYNLDLIKPQKIPEINEEVKSSVGFNSSQNKIIPSKLMKSIASLNLKNHQNIQEEFKFNENINYQDIYNVKEFISKFNEDDQNPINKSFIQRFISKESIDYSFKDQLLELFCIHKWKSK